MDCDVAKYSKERYDEVAAEMRNVLAKVGFKKKVIADSIPILPISGWKGDNLLTKSENMGWWKGVDVKTTVGKTETVHVHTLLDCLNNMVKPPVRDDTKKMRMPVSGIYKIKGVGDVITGRVEQGLVKPGAEVIFPPTHTSSNTAKGKVFTVEMHHKSVEQAGCGDNVGLNIKGLDKGNMPQVGDCMVLATDDTIKPTKSFVAQVQILDHPGQLKVGYTPIAFVRTGRSAVKMSKIDWKIGKETGGKKLEGPKYVKANEVAQVVFEPQQPFCVDSFKNCEGLGRVAIMEGNGIVMLGKVVKASS
jgi:elongation factor 1-alpha